ncbi:hypothetical protein BG015_004628 [Linnemannia schmuckeri]|uniref:Uncharacterized protein n=1 Tax=Linnemannia schmuckeri TaxID=64567 RepID=A0A9P5RAJ9_9FUNG|nr:hypothetical protein BG015_004628 [Linnemannia schmuckeri]
MNAEKTLKLPEILELVGWFCHCLAERAILATESSGHMGPTTLTPRHCSLSSLVNSPYSSLVADIRLYDYGERGSDESSDSKHASHSLSLSLMDMNHKKRVELWDALKDHEHIGRLEVQDSNFPIRKLLGTKTHTLTELKLLGNCIRLIPDLIDFVERLHYLKSLEVMWIHCLIRIVFSPTSPTFAGFSNNTATKINISISGAGANTASGNNTSNNNIPTNGNNVNAVGINVVANNAIANKTLTTSCISPSYGGEIMTGKRKRGVEDPRVIEGLPTKHLVLCNNRLRQPFQKQILETCSKLEQLEICFSEKPIGSKVASLVFRVALSSDV